MIFQKKIKIFQKISKKENYILSGIKCLNKVNKYALLKLFCHLHRSDMTLCK